MLLGFISICTHEKNSANIAFVCNYKAQTFPLSLNQVYKLSSRILSHYFTLFLRIQPHLIIIDVNERWRFLSKISQHRPTFILFLIQVGCPVSYVEKRSLCQLIPYLCYTELMEVYWYLYWMLNQCGFVPVLSAAFPQCFNISTVFQTLSYCKFSYFSLQIISTQLNYYIVSNFLLYNIYFLLLK